MKSVFLEQAQRLINLVFPGRVRRPEVRRKIESEFQNLIAGSSSDSSFDDIVLIDIGANVGRAYDLCRVRPEKYIGFEPDPVAFKILESRLGISEEVNLISAAAWIENGHLELFRHKDFAHSQSTTSSSLMDSKKNVDSYNAVKVRTIDFPTFLGEIDGQVVVKIDAEGAEYDILRALASRGTLLRKCDFFVEFHPTKLRWGRIRHARLVMSLIRSKSWQRIRLWP